MNAITTISRRAIEGVPDTLLADCVLNIGKRGSGKSYTFRLAMERALTRRVRCGWIDAMGIGWGVCVAADGQIAGYRDVVVFGGEHAHVQISENAGAALGAYLAVAPLSWVLDLKGLKSKAARVRFMADFVDAIYETCREPLLLLLDEVDLWAPQMILDKQGPSMRLLGAMHELVRRGRIHGLSVWMASQRPAEVSKGIISQVDAMFTFKLMSPQDLEAAMSWMKGHLGKEAAAEWAAKIPGLKKGEAIVYLTEPEISVRQVQFPQIHTLDTFTPPKKGDTGPSDKAMAQHDIKRISIELGDLAKQMAAEDPKALRERVGVLEHTLDLANEDGDRLAAENKLLKANPLVLHDPGAADHRYKEGFREGFFIGWRDGWSASAAHAWEVLEGFKLRTPPVPGGPRPEDIQVPPDGEAAAPPVHNLGEDGGKQAVLPQVVARTPPPLAVSEAPRRRVRNPNLMAAVEVTHPADAGEFKMTTPHQRLLDAMAWWLGARGVAAPTRTMVAILARYTPGTGNVKNMFGQLVSYGLIESVGPGLVKLTDAGRARVSSTLALPGAQTMIDAAKSLLSAAETKLFNIVLDNRVRGEISRNDVATAAGYTPGTGNVKNMLGHLVGLSLIESSRPGFVKLAPWFSARGDG